jgi:hypothetical protein
VDWQLAEVRAWIAQRPRGTTHQGFPVVAQQQHLVGMVSQSDLLDLKQPDSKRVSDLVRSTFVVAFKDNPARNN